MGQVPDGFKEDGMFNRRQANLINVRIEDMPHSCLLFLPADAIEEDHDKWVKLLLRKMYSPAITLRPYFVLTKCDVLLKSQDCSQIYDKWEILNRIQLLAHSSGCTENLILPTVNYTAYFTDRNYVLEFLALEILSCAVESAIAFIADQQKLAPAPAPAPVPAPAPTPTPAPAYPRPPTVRIPCHIILADKKELVLDIKMTNIASLTDLQTYIATSFHGYPVKTIYYSNTVGVRVSDVVHLVPHDIEQDELRQAKVFVVKQ